MTKKSYQCSWEKTRDIPGGVSGNVLAKKRIAGFFSILSDSQEEAVVMAASRLRYMKKRGEHYTTVNVEEASIQQYEISHDENG